LASEPLAQILGTLEKTMPKKPAAVAPLKLLKTTPVNIRKTAKVADAPTEADYPIQERRIRNKGLNKI
jgi:hypothetical protein